MDQFIQWVMQQTGITDYNQLMQVINSGDSRSIAIHNAMNQYGVDPNQAYQYLQQKAAPWAQQAASGGQQVPMGQPNTQQVYNPTMPAAQNPNQMGQAIGGVNYAAVGAYQNMTPQQQAFLASQGLAPNIQQANVGKQGQTWGYGPPGQNGPQTWTRTADGGYLMNGHYFGADGKPVSAPSGGAGTPVVGGGAGLPGMNIPGLGNTNIQNSAVSTQGALSNLNQQAAASGDSDQLAYKQARLAREVQAGQSSSMLDNILKQAQIAQMFSNAAAQGGGLNTAMATMGSPVRM